MKQRVLVFTVFLALVGAAVRSAPWGAAKATAVPEADGYVAIPNAAVPPAKGRVYKAVFDANHAAEKPTQLLPAINNLGSELNAFAATGLPKSAAKFVLVFHGPAMDGILDDTHYRAKHGVANPNLKVLSRLKAAGVEMFVCGQNLATDKIDPRTLTPDVRVASDALIVLMTYQNDGYALLSF
ncbi:MAG TPA: DsrE family protein [Thermoanaerobaculia bacterium]|nr:DsrE family protein [Thermoanaerobaculia bacterium]